MCAASDFRVMVALKDWYPVFINVKAWMDAKSVDGNMQGRALLKEHQHLKRLQNMTRNL